MYLKLGRYQYYALDYNFTSSSIKNGLGTFLLTVVQFYSCVYALQCIGAGHRPFNLYNDTRRSWENLGKSAQSIKPTKEREGILRWVRFYPDIAKRSQVIR